MIPVIPLADSGVDLLTSRIFQVSDTFGIKGIPVRLTKWLSAQPRIMPKLSLLWEGGQVAAVRPESRRHMKRL